MIPNIVFIHGASSSSRSFNWIKQNLPVHNETLIEYDDHRIPSLVDELVELANDSAPFHIVGHSLGGVIGVAVAQRSFKVKKVVTIAAPFGGSQFAAFMRFFAPGSILDQVQPYSPLMTIVRSRAITCPVLSIVATGGQAPLFNEPNDGIITVASQKCLKGVASIEFPINHFEVLLSSEVALSIRNFLWGSDYEHNQTNDLHADWGAR